MVVGYSSADLQSTPILFISIRPRAHAEDFPIHLSRIFSFSISSFYDFYLCNPAFTAHHVHATPPIRVGESERERECSVVQH